MTDKPAPQPDERDGGCGVSAIQPRLDRTLDDMIAEAHAIIDESIDRWQPESVWAGFSGGNDSTVMLDVVRRHPALDGALHVDTTIGIQRTREFVREVCDQWGLDLRVVRPPRSYDELVRRQGFYGPKDHRYAYIQLKKEAIREFKRQMLEPRKSTRVMIVTGMRASESTTRMSHGSGDRLEERVVWSNPIRHWTGDDMAEYRQRHPDLPRNPVNDALGKSGECLCGCFSVGPVELPIVRELDPETADQIERLQAELAESGSPYCRWGPGGEGAGVAAGPMCTGCDALFEDATGEGAA